MMQTFAPGRDVDDATLLMARFANGSAGCFEATRYATGCRNQNRFEIHGERGMLRFNLEDLNHLEFADASEPRNVQGLRRIMTTGPDHPYAANFWKPGHGIGYEHTFIAALGDFLQAAARGEPFHPDFDDGARWRRLRNEQTCHEEIRPAEKTENQARASGFGSQQSGGTGQLTFARSEARVSACHR